MGPWALGLAAVCVNLKAHIPSWNLSFLFCKVEVVALCASHCHCRVAVGMASSLCKHLAHARYLVDGGYYYALVDLFWSFVGPCHVLRDILFNCVFWAVNTY